jgi:uncharacterized peroxidase-related enzyme
MPRLKPIDDASVTAEAKTLLEEIRAAYGSVPNGLLTMAVSPALLRAAVEMGKALSGTLPGPLRERIAIAIAEQNGCRYCLSAHTAAGRSLGIDDDELTRSRTGESADPALAAALAFAREVNTTRGGVTDEDVAKVRAAGYDDAGIAVIVGHVALNVLSNYFNRVAQPDLDFPHVDPDLARAA